MGYQPIETRASFDRHVTRGVTKESLHLEFKATYRWSNEKREIRQEDAIEVCRDIAQFANADGGVLIVGVTEVTTNDGRRVADEILSVHEPDNFIGWVEQAIRNNLVPATLARTIRVIETTDGLIVAINVPPHVYPVAVWPQASRRAMEYLKRNNHGKAWLNPDEAQEHLMDGSRAIHLAAKRVFEQIGHQHRPLDLVPPVSKLAPVIVNNRLVQRFGRDPEARPVLTGIGDHHIEVAIYPSGQCVHIPFALVRSIWLTSDLRPALSMSARIVRDDADDSTGYYLDAL
jgi:hypothetical protein